MRIDEFRNICISKKGVTEDFPFDETTLVFRVGGKIFALTDTEALPLSFNLKCDPERAIALREENEGITPGYHMNKKHWNTIIPENGVPVKLIMELVEHSYNLVFNSLKKSDKELIMNLE